MVLGGEHDQRLVDEGQAEAAQVSGALVEGDGVLVGAAGLFVPALFVEEEPEVGVVPAEVAQVSGV